MVLGKVKELTTLLAASLLVGGIGCGDAGSNNDQGTSVTALRYCADGMCTLGESGTVVPLSSDITSLNAGLGFLDGQAVETFIQIANRLAEQFVRIDRVDCEYTIPGADPSLRIPTDSSVVGGVIEANPGANDDSTGIFAFFIVSADLFAFMNNNRASLPELPFRAVATCQAVGVTQSGDTVETNYLNYSIQFGDVSECCTGTLSETPGSTSGGFQGGPGSGGDLNTFDPAPGNAVGNTVENNAGGTGDTTVSGGADTTGNTNVADEGTLL